MEGEGQGRSFFTCVALVCHTVGIEANLYHQSNLDRS